MGPDWWRHPCIDTAAVQCGRRKVRCRSSFPAELGPFRLHGRGWPCLSATTLDRGSSKTGNFRHPCEHPMITFSSLRTAQRKRLGYTEQSCCDIWYEENVLTCTKCFILAVCTRKNVLAYTKSLIRYGPGDCACQLQLWSKTDRVRGQNRTTWRENKYSTNAVIFWVTVR